MMTVRYPNGLAIQYNSANFLKYFEGCWTLYTNKDCTQAVASIQVSAGVTVELIPACKVYNPTANKSIEEMVDAILEQRTIGWNDGAALRRLKDELRKFDARKLIWREK